MIDHRIFFQSYQCISAFTCHNSSVTNEFDEQCTSRSTVEHTSPGSTWQQVRLPAAEAMRTKPGCQHTEGNIRARPSHISIVWRSLVSINREAKHELGDTPVSLYYSGVRWSSGSTQACRRVLSLWMQPACTLTVVLWLTLWFKRRRVSLPQTLTQAYPTAVVQDQSTRMLSNTEKKVASVVKTKWHASLVLANCVDKERAWAMYGSLRAEDGSDDKCANTSP